MPFDIQGFTQTREVRGGNKLVKVREWRVISLPSDTYFQFRRDGTQPCFAKPKPCAKQFSDRIEAVMDDERVVDVVYSQDTTAGGRLVDMMTTYWESVDGAVDGSFEQELKNFGPSVTLPRVGREIAEARAELGG